MMDDQQQWYRDVYLPLVKRMWAGERIESWLPNGGMRQANEDETWDQHHADNWT
jgi:hypothetical protein